MATEVSGMASGMSFGTPCSKRGASMTGPKLPGIHGNRDRRRRRTFLHGRSETIGMDAGTCWIYTSGGHCVQMLEEYVLRAYDGGYIVLARVANASGVGQYVVDCWLDRTAHDSFSLRWGTRCLPTIQFY